MTEPTLDEREARLKRALNPDFLDQLIEAARVYGWFGDYTEVRQFVQWCHETGGFEMPSREAMEPYKD